MVNDLANDVSEVEMATVRSSFLATMRGSVVAVSGLQILPAAQAAKPKASDGSSDAWAAEKWTAKGIYS